VFDWLALGLHTGLRLGEYGQSKPSKKHPTLCLSPGRFFKPYGTPP
jgi:hypothetical protein